MYGLALIGLVVLVLAFVRMSRAITRISQSLEEISAAMRSDLHRRQPGESSKSLPGNR